MKKSYFTYRELANGKLISNTANSLVYRMNDGTILKIFNTLFLQNLKSVGEDKEAKILNSYKIKNVPEIVLPKEALYLSNDTFVGYKMDEAKGIDYNKYDDNLTLKQRCDLKLYRDEYLKLEDMVKRAHKEKIIMPDFCTFDNLFIDEKGNFQMIDYDGLQIGDYVSSAISTSLGDEWQYYVPKYFENELFTENLDIKSLIIMYFLQTFNINLNKVGCELPDGSGKVTLDYVFNQLNLYDYDFMQKVWKCFNDNVDNEFIGEDVIRIAENYDMTTQAYTLGEEKVYLKRLTKK